MTKDDQGRKALWTNTSVMGRTGRPSRNDLSPQRVQGHIPLLLHQGTPQRVLGIGFGTGQTFAAQLLHPIEQLDVVDISSSVIETALKHFPEYLSELGRDPRVRLIVDDGRAFVDRTHNKYDVVLLEMPPHEEAGIVHFYTTEFYEKLRTTLRPNGIAAQWVPIYNLTAAETAGVIRTFIAIFPEAGLWYNATNFLLLGVNGKFSLDVNNLLGALEREGVSRDLAGLSRPEAGLGNRALVKEGYAVMLAPGTYRLASLEQTRERQWT